jgi:hypothetical protein
MKTDIPETQDAAGIPSRDWEETAVRLFDCSAKFEREATIMKEAISFCLATLKSHHMTKPGISAIVRKVEDILADTSVSGPCPPDAAHYDTPRTDAEAIPPEQCGAWDEYVPAVLSRQLERENAKQHNKLMKIAAALAQAIRRDDNSKHTALRRWDRYLSNAASDRLAGNPAGRSE